MQNSLLQHLTWKTNSVYYNIILYRERAEGHECDFGKGGHLRPLALAATCGHLRPLALAATCGHLLWRPLAATCGHLRPLAATCSGGHLRPLDWLQVAASGCRWEENTGGHWRPLDWPQVGASGCRMLPIRREWWRPLAATGGHWRSLEWLQVAASGCQAWVKHGETIFFTIHPLLGGEYWEFSVACARKIYNILRGWSLGNVKYCTVLISMLRAFLLSEARRIWNVLGHVASRSSLFSLQRCPPLLISPSS